jgi:hypothetical protein
MTPAEVVRRLEGWKSRCVMGGWWTVYDEECYHEAVVRLSKEAQ